MAVTSCSQVYDTL